MFEIVDDLQSRVLVSVVGIGGCGCNTINMLNELGVSERASLVAINTDSAALNHCSVEKRILIGENLTHGYGAGADPAIGLEAARESRAQIVAEIEGSDFVVLTTGMGGGTGTGATPFVAEIASELGKPCICVATLPFVSEGKMRMNYAQEGMAALRSGSVSLITLPNEQLVTALGESVGIFSAFKHSNQMLQSILGSLIGLLTDTGQMNVDFNDFCRVMDYPGDAILGVGRASAESDVIEAIQSAVANPLAERIELGAAKGIILQINCREEISMLTYNTLTNYVNEKSADDVLILCGLALTPELDVALEVLVIATGAEDKTQEKSSHRVEYIGGDPILDIPTFLRNNQSKVVN